MKLAALALFGLLASWPDTAAMAQTAPSPPATAASSPSKVDDARKHFQRGVELFRDGSFDAALAEFERAYEIAPNYRILYDLGQVDVERQDYAAAIRMFRGYLETGGNDVAPERRSALSKQLDELGLRVGRVFVNSDTNGAEIAIDDVTVGTIPLSAPLLVNAGIRRMIVRSPGRVSDSRSLTVVGGETLRVDVVLSGEPDLSQESGAAPSGERTPHKTASLTAMWIGVATTAVLTATWATFAVLAKQADDDLSTELNQYPVDRGTLDDQRSKDRTFSNLADGFAAGAVVALGFTIYEGIRTGAWSSPKVGSPPRAELRVVPTGLAGLVRF